MLSFSLKGLQKNSTFHLNVLRLVSRTVVNILHLNSKQLGGGRNRIGRREKSAQKVGRREIYHPVPPPSVSEIVPRHTCTELESVRFMKTLSSTSGRLLEVAIKHGGPEEKGVMYTCQLFLGQRREIFILRVLGFPEMTRPFPKMSEVFRRRSEHIPNTVPERVC